MQPATVLLVFAGAAALMAPAGGTTNWSAISPDFQSRFATTSPSISPSASPTTAPSSSPGTLSVVGFNVQIFGVSKMGNPEVVAALVDIITRHDLVVVQEIRDSSGTGEPEFHHPIPTRPHLPPRAAAPRISRYRGLSCWLATCDGTRSS